VGSIDIGTQVSRSGSATSITKVSATSGGRETTTGQIDTPAVEPSALAARICDKTLCVQFPAPCAD